MSAASRGSCLRLALVAVLLAAPPARGWGFAAHRMIEEEAIETLSEPLRAYFREHREEISDGSIEPDTVLRARDGAREASRHFIDLDLYGAPPFADLPRSYRAAVDRFGRRAVVERGTLPWTIEQKHAELRREMREGRWPQALRTAAHAGHYVADATMPLHAVSNYDGRRTGNAGIHKAVEHDLVDERIARFRTRVRARQRPATAADYGRERVFAVIFESFAAAPELLDADRRARRLGAVGSPAYVESLDDRLGALLAARLARAVDLLGGFWQSAWEEAGRPVPR
ncbi:MAG: hypothetical protein HYY35_00510 [Deltaproteobacteria bacterium]|nr:hypothetical protein [Deltaproteobacteria bacterium]